MDIDVMEQDCNRLKDAFTPTIVVREEEDDDEEAEGGEEAEEDDGDSIVVKSKKEEKEAEEEEEEELQMRMIEDAVRNAQRLLESVKLKGDAEEDAEADDQVDGESSENHPQDPSRSTFKKRPSASASSSSCTTSQVGPGSKTSTYGKSSVVTSKNPNAASRSAGKVKSPFPNEKKIEIPDWRQMKEFLKGFKMV